MPSHTTRVCTRDACERPIIARGLCKKHYENARYHQRKHNTRKRIAPFDRFMQRTRRDDESGCWLWQGPLDANGYGQFQKGRPHRWIYAYCNGPIPDGLSIDHLCRNRACVFLPHLQAVTPSENSRRVHHRGQYPTAHYLQIERIFAAQARKQEAFFSRLHDIMSKKNR